MRIVIDCNVVISAGLTVHGNCRKVIKRTLEDYELIVTDLILDEYNCVARRNTFAKAQHSLVDLISIMENTATKIPDIIIDDLELPDLDDLIYLYATINSGARYLITGNIKDFPDQKYRKVKVLTPRDFLALKEPIFELI